jgi:hypothetical protein
LSYRSDLEAAHERASASEREVARLERELAATKKPLEPAVLEMPIPDKFRVSREDDDVRVSWRWGSPWQHVTGLIFAIIWCVVSVAAMAQGQGTIGPLAFLGLGVGLIYGAIAGLVNRTTIRVSNGRLHVTHGPLPWRGNAVLDRAALEQIYVNHEVDSETATTYDVRALLTNGRSRKLVKKLKERSEARYIEHVVEDALGIVDAPVPGETGSLRRGADVAVDEDRVRRLGALDGVAVEDRVTAPARLHVRIAARVRGHRILERMLAAVARRACHPLDLAIDAADLDRLLLGALRVGESGDVDAVALRELALVDDHVADTVFAALAGRRRCLLRLDAHHAGLGAVAIECPARGGLVERLVALRLWSEPLVHRTQADVLALDVGREAVRPGAAFAAKQLEAFAGFLGRDRSQRRFRGVGLLDGRRAVVGVDDVAARVEKLVGHRILRRGPAAAAHE